MYIAARKMGRAEVPAGSMGGEGAVRRPRSYEAAVFFGLAKIIEVPRVARPACARRLVPIFIADL